MKQLLNKNTFIYLTLIIASVSITYLMRPKDNSDLIEYQFKQNQIRLDSIETKYNRLENVTRVINNRLNIKYNEIDSSNISEFNDLLGDFARRTGGFGPNRVK